MMTAKTRPRAAFRFPGTGLAALTALVALGAGAARAQDMPEPAARDLWCGLALTVVAAGAPSDATEEQKALAARFAEGGTMLTDRARAALLESGFSEAALGEHIEKLRGEVADAVDRAQSEPAYSFEECAALLPS